MERHSINLIMDQRQKYLGEQLGCKVILVPLKEAVSDNFLREKVETAECIFLPTPVSKIEKIQDEFEKLKQALRKGQKVFGGKIPEDLKEWMEEREISCWDLMEEEEVALANAKVTAEATICEILQRSSYSIEGQKFVIAGYGRCAKELAWRLGALGGKVTILARRAEARKQAKKDGFCAVDFCYAPEEAYGARTFVNTVPAMVLTEPVFAEMHRDTLVLDLASRPGGCDKKAAEKHQIPVVNALGLPGIYTTRTSAAILADAIRSKTVSPENGKKEKSWIFQIII